MPSSEIDEPASDDLVADFYDEAQGDGLVSVARGPLRSLVARARLALSQPALPGQEAFEALSAAQTPLEPEYAAALYSNRSELYMKSAPEVPDTEQDIADAQTALDEYHKKGGKTMAEVEAELADGDPINRWVTILDAAAPSSFVGWTNPDPEVPDTGGLVERTVVYNDPADIYAANIERDLAIDRAQAAEQALAEAAAELSRLQSAYRERDGLIDVETAELLQLLEERALSYDQSGPSAEHTAKLLRDASYAIRRVNPLLARKDTALTALTEDNKRLREALVAAKRLTAPALSPFHKMALTNLRAIARTIDAALTLAKGEHNGQ